ncbi:Paraquat-inducible protein A [Magnetococcus marinus MC-1]|uniref:Paraquat-inducible protein A n=1 Tax=Magnetococcus marinus (strain ATCC BAA-1437 / JCM 17883 / MC-1) TaxID=156889 RepID=A0LD17_MAGMM|nr:paraquat-inducible protein A [Magnetococcus marinus]ABK45860.1 Paraquat-inducible protein A [Magnetococcus marinus MC-1]
MVGYWIDLYHRWEPMQTPVTTDTMACPWCDTLHKVPTPLPEGQFHCVRCHSTLFHYKQGGARRALAWALSGLILLIPAITLPFMALEAGGQWQAGSILDGVIALWESGSPVVGALVLLTGMLAPTLHIAGLAFVAWLMRRDTPPPHWAAPLYRQVGVIRHWSMLEVYMLGLIVAATKLGDLAHVSMEQGLWAFVGLVVATSRAGAALEPALAWRRWQVPR